MIWFYGILSVLGILLPYSSFLPWLSAHGLNFSLLIHEAASTSIGLFAWWDVLVSVMVLIVFIMVESKRLHLKTGWLAIASTCIVGVSLGLPLFLLLREWPLKKQ